MDFSNNKFPLRHGNIGNYNSIVRRTWSAGSRISCKVHNYVELKSSIYHCLTRTVSDSEFVFKLLKKGKWHFFQLHCDLMGSMTFRVVYSEDDHSEAIRSRTVEYGYWVDVPMRIVCDSRNKFLHEENSLVVQFSSDWSYSFSMNPSAVCGKRTLRDEELFSQDMEKLYGIRERTGDFSIVVQGEKFIVHKFVFYARAMWFKNNPQSFSREQISIIGEPLVMDRVVRYMYSGVLEETEQEGMLHMLAIAVTLQMKGLIQTIDSVLRKMLTKDNAQNLLKTAKKLRMDELARFVAEHFTEGESSPERKRRGKNHRRRHR